MLKRAPYSSLVLLRQQPFYAWLAMADRTENSIEDYVYADDYGTYLTQEDLNTPEEINDFLNRHFNVLFENELNQWHRRELWPKNLTRQMFDQWFSVKINREVFFAG
jgi:hypothetical protein